MSAVFAPRPQFFLSVTGDWTHAFPREGYPEIEALYRELGAAGAVSGLQWDRGHDYDRPMRNAAYAFFERWLAREDNPGLSLEPEDLATESIDTLRGLDRTDALHDPQAIVDEFRARLSVDEVDDASEPGKVRERLAALLGPGASGDRVELQGNASEELRRGRVRSAGQPDVPLLALRGGGHGVAICTSERGMASTWIGRASLVAALRERFAAVWLADVRYFGELDVGTPFRALHGRFFGQDEGQVGVLDLRRLAAAAPGEGAVTLVALGQTGALAVLAAGVDPRIGSVIAPDLGPTWRESTRGPELSRILLHGDLPEAVFGAAGARFHIGGSPAHPSWAVVDRQCSERLVRRAPALGDDELASLIRSW
jgi:hypothetical protein